MSSTKHLMQGKLFQRCTHFLYCSVLSLGGNVNTRRMSKPDMGSIFHIKIHWNFLVIENYYLNYQNYQNSMLLTFSDTKRKLMHLFLVYKFRPERTGFNMYAEFTQLQLTFLALHSWVHLAIPSSHTSHYSLILPQEVWGSAWRGCSKSWQCPGG